MSTCIGILSFNHPEITKRAVHSALKFSYPVILLHNGSQKKFVDSLIQEFPNITHLVFEDNKGYSGGVNRLLEAAFKNFERILFLTNDTECLKIEKWPSEKGFYAPKILFRKIDRIDSLGGGFSPIKGKLRHIKNPEEKLLKNEYFYVPGTAFILDREVFLKVGHFDEGLHTYWEDVDFSMRVQKLNLICAYFEGVTILHRVGKTCHDNPFYSIYLFRRNQRRVSLRYLSGFKKIYAKSYFYYLFLKKTYYLLGKKDRERIKLYLRAMRDL